MSPKLPMLVLGDLAQDAAHDLAGAGLRQAGAHCSRSGLAIGPISLRTHCTSSLRSRRWLSTRLQRDIGVDALALDVVGIADHGGFGDLAVRDQRAFDFRRAHAVAGHVDARRRRGR